MGWASGHGNEICRFEVGGRAPSLRGGMKGVGLDNREFDRDENGAKQSHVTMLSDRNRTSMRIAVEIIEAEEDYQEDVNSNSH